jgi:hypothetical protein
MMSNFSAPRSEPPQDGKQGSWEPFHNRTHNGFYWALHRWNERWMGRVQVMHTKGGHHTR